MKSFLLGCAVLLVFAGVCLWYFNIRTPQSLSLAAVLPTRVPGQGTATSALPSPTPTASAKGGVVRINQLDPAQYASQAEYTTWAYSTCSTAAMAEVLNFYDHRNFTVHDVLVKETQADAITPALGLVSEAGIAQTVVQFGFQTAWGHQFTLDELIDMANRGRPAIVGIPPSRIPGGHLLVLTGGTGTTVSLVDSSARNWKTLSRAAFLSYWDGFAAVISPKLGG